jgi:hypothetical protein
MSARRRGGTSRGTAGYPSFAPQPAHWGAPAGLPFPQRMHHAVPPPPPAAAGGADDGRGAAAGGAEATGGAAVGAAYGAGAGGGAELGSGAAPRAPWIEATQESARGVWKL